MAGLQQIGGTGQQHQASIDTEIETLEEDVAECVVAGQVVHALLPEHQETIEADCLHSGDCLGPPLGEFLDGEMKAHAASLRYDCCRRATALPAPPLSAA